MTQTALPPLAEPQTAHRPPGNETRVLWIAGGLFAVLWLLGATLSQGFLGADACTHYLSARFGFREPTRLVSVWNRPLFMLTYAPAASLGGVMGARAVSFAMTITCALTAWRIALRMGHPRPQLAFIFTLASPLIFLHSISERTELCFAALVGLAFSAWLARRWWLLAALIALSPLGRPEGFALIPLAAVALVAAGRYKPLLMLPLCLMLWSLAGWWLWGFPDYGSGPLNFLLWLPRQWPYSGQSTYPPGPLLGWLTQSDGHAAGSFLLRLPVLVSPLLFPFLLAGTGAMARRAIRSGTAGDAGLSSLAAVALPWAMLAGHSVLWWRGWMASDGELRYMLAAGPLWAVVTAFGFYEVLTRLHVRRLWLLAGILSLLPGVANLYFGVVPIALQDREILARDVVEWYFNDSDFRQSYPRLAASCTAVYQHMDVSSTDWSRTVRWSKQTVREAPAGVVLVWDEVFGPRNADLEMCITQEELIVNGWIKLREFTRGQCRWEVYTSPEPLVTGKSQTR